MPVAMEVAVIQFPGSNCDRDAFHAVEDVLRASARLVWHKETNLGNATAVIVPGGFSYGDYLRCGAIARFSPVMHAVKAFAEGGGPVLGICNGFQVLCESGLLPGALIRNAGMAFRCETVTLRVEDSDDAFSRSALGETVRIPIAHGEGNYFIDAEGLARLEANRQILFRYATRTGVVTHAANPNGSLANIAGIRSAQGNVWGMMPHPERAVERFHPSQDGIRILRAFLADQRLIAA